MNATNHNNKNAEKDIFALEKKIPPLLIHNRNKRLRCKARSERRKQGTQQATKPLSTPVTRGGKKLG